MQANACSELQRIALACSDERRGDALLLQTSAWVLADMQRLMSRAAPLSNSDHVAGMAQAWQPLPLPPSAICADISIRCKAEVLRSPPSPSSLIFLCTVDFVVS